MADNIHFLTFEDTGTRSNSSGCCGFPWQITAGSDDDHPLGITIQDVAKWFRVKNWKLTSTWTATTMGTTAGMYNGNLVPRVGPPSNATRENELFLNDTVHSFDKNTGLQSVILVMLYPFLGPVFVTGSVFNPYLSIKNTAFSPGGPSPFPGNVSFSFNQADLTIVSGSFTAVIDGKNITCYYDVGSSPPDSFSVGTLIFDPIEYWPFAASDGSPIWDTATGAQLQNENN